MPVNDILRSFGILETFVICLTFLRTLNLDLSITFEILDICSGSLILRLSLIHYHIYFSSEWLLQGKFLIVIYRIECNIKIFLLTNFIIPGLLQRCGRWLLRTRVCLILSKYSQFQLAPVHQSLIKKRTFEIFWNCNWFFRYFEI